MSRRWREFLRGIRFDRNMTVEEFLGNLAEGEIAAYFTCDVGVYDNGSPYYPLLEDYPITLEIEDMDGGYIRCTINGEVPSGVQTARVVNLRYMEDIDVFELPDKIFLQAHETDFEEDLFVPEGLVEAMRRRAQEDLRPQEA